MKDEGDPMAIAATERRDGETLAELAERLDVPEGFRVEIVDGSILVSPTPRISHGKILTKLILALETKKPADLAVVQPVTIELASDTDRYVPDLVALRGSEISDDQWLVPAKAVILAAEIVSPGDPERDRVTKLRGYAHAHVPLYLLVDPLERATTLFSRPAEGRYHRQLHASFGEKLELPEPFSLNLDTGEFG